MAKLVDSSVWIDLTRARSPKNLKEFVAKQLADPQVCLADPVAFEVLRHANDAEVRLLTRLFESVPSLKTPAELWGQAMQIGRSCRAVGITVGSLDLLIAAIAIYHDAEIVTFDNDFDKIASVSSLRVKVLKRPTEK